MFLNACNKYLDLLMDCRTQGVIMVEEFPCFCKFFQDFCDNTVARRDLTLKYSKGVSTLLSLNGILF